MLVRAFPLALLTLAAAFLLAPRGLEAQEPASSLSRLRRSLTPDNSSQTRRLPTTTPPIPMPQWTRTLRMPPNRMPRNRQRPRMRRPIQPHPLLRNRIGPSTRRPAMATVTWDSHGLAIDAANSSLKQILNDISTATGAKVEGMNADERVFGAYGPGQARDVLSQLLLGAGYNVIMIGDQGQGAPRQILLSTKRSTAPKRRRPRKARPTGTTTTPDNEVEEQPPQPIQPPMTAGISRAGRR